MNRVFIRFCAYHNDRHQLFLNQVVTVSHGMCVYCFEREMAKFDMKRNSPEWVKLLADGGWESRPGSGYFPDYVLGSYTVRMDYDKLQWVRYDYDKEIARGDLDFVLECV